MHRGHAYLGFVISQSFPLCVVGWNTFLLTKNKGQFHGQATKKEQRENHTNGSLVLPASVGSSNISFRTKSRKLKAVVRTSVTE